jgi:rhodanese-related sulfurtransferase
LRTPQSSLVNAAYTTLEKLDFRSIENPAQTELRADPEARNNSGGIVKKRTFNALLWRAFALVVIISLSIPAAHAQFQPPGSPASASSIPLESVVQPGPLNEMLQRPSHPPVLILQVGSHLLYSQAHIPGSEYAGPASQPEGLETLRKRVTSEPKTKLIVLYCGCCPWDRCPNIGPAYRQLRDLGFTNVKAVYMASNFGDDWVAKGYPVEKGR